MADVTLEPPQDPGAGHTAALSLTRATAVMSAGTALSRLTGFVRIAVMAWAIGGAESKLPDTYNLANSLPNIVYQLVLGEVLATVFVPVFVEHIKTRPKEEASRLASSILSLAFVVSAAFAAATVIAAPWLIRIYTFRIADPLTRHAQEQVGAFWLRLFMPQMIFYATGAVLTGLLNAHRKFAAPMFAPVLNNLIVMATFVIFRFEHRAGTPQLTGLSLGDKVLLGGGTTLGVIAMTMVLWPYVMKLRGGYRLGSMDWRNPAIRHVGTLAKFSFGYVIVNQIALWVVNALANRTNGGVTAYQYAWTFYQLPYGIFAVSVMTFLVTKLAEHNVAKDHAAMRADISLGLRSTAFIVLPASAGFVALSVPLYRLLFQHGTFSSASTTLFAQTFAWMSVGLGAFAAFQQIMRAFYAMQDTRTPFVINNWAMVAQIAAGLALYRAMGVPGLALAHALSYGVGAVVGGAVLRSRLGGLDGRRVAIAHARIAVASAVTGVVAWLVARVLQDSLGSAGTTGRLVAVSAAVVAGTAVYGIGAKLLKIEEFGPLLAIVRGRFGKATA
jgi:putative peptidoglycan lipid II flippase